MQPLLRTQAFERYDTPMRHSRHRCHAGADRLAFEMDRARATLTKSATESWSVQAKVVAQRIEQWHFRIIDLNGNGPSVEIERYRLRHDQPSLAPFICDTNVLRT